VDEDEVAEEEAAEDEIEIDGVGGEPEQKRGQGYGGQEDSCKEEGAVTMMEVVTGFEMLFLSGLAVEQASVEKAVGGVEHPDGDEHGEDGGDGKTNVVGGADEPDPE
jgi:hypothetical protein